jgi:hypothetical protein
MWGWMADCSMNDVVMIIFLSLSFKGILLTKLSKSKFVFFFSSYFKIGKLSLLIEFKLYVMLSIKS